MILAGNPVLTTARDFWRGLPMPFNIPDIRLLDPASIPPLILPHLIIAETTMANFDLSRLRLVGSEIARWFREMPEGMDARAYGALTDRAYMQHMRDLLAELIQRRKPVYCRSVYTLPGLTADDAPNIVTAERLALPMGDGAPTVGCVMIVETLHASDFRAGPLRILPPEPGIAVVHDDFEVPE
jgi:hypothetical protein